ncbi:MAG: lysophospholipid acyltransferase family protein [Prevotellaceae bacterium]|nr:lysophospholipid acyltransferase family protein [Prevotellaceae bacterium]
MVQPKRWSGVTGGGSLGRKSLTLLLRYVNVTAVYVALALVVPFYMLFARRGFLAIYRYFRRQWHFSPLKSLCKTYVNHFVFGQCMLDRFAIYAGQRRRFTFSLIGNEVFMRLLDDPKGFIVAGAHVGNFEISGYTLRQDKKRINTMVFGGESRDMMAQKLEMFGKNNISLLSAERDMSHIFALNRALLEGEIVCMTCDRNVGSAKSVTCRFLNGEAEIPQGAFALAAHFDVPVITVFVMKEASTRYNVYVSALSADAASRQEKIRQLAVAYANTLEAVVRRYPEQWFNFYNFWG